MAEQRGERRVVVGVFAKSMIVRNGFRLCIDNEFVGIAAARFAVQRGAPLTENFFKLFQWLRRKLFHCFDAERTQRAFGNFTDAGNLAHRERREKARFASRRDPQQAARLGLVRSDFGDEARRGKSAGTRKTCGARDGAQEFVGRGERRPVQALGAGEIEISFVNRNHFHDGGKLREDRGDAIAPLRIELVAQVQKNGVRAKAAGGAQRHRPANAVFACFVAGRGNYAALIGLPADDHGLAAQFWAVEQFHGDKARVYIDVQDRRDARRRGLVKRTVLGTEASQFRHDFIAYAFPFFFARRFRPTLARRQGRGGCRRGRWLYRCSPRLLRREAAGLR